MLNLWMLHTYLFIENKFCSRAFSVRFAMVFSFSTFDIRCFIASRARRCRCFFLKQRRLDNNNDQWLEREKWHVSDAIFLQDFVPAYEM